MHYLYNVIRCFEGIFINKVLQAYKEAKNDPLDSFNAISFDLERKIACAKYAQGVKTFKQVPSLESYLGVASYWGEILYWRNVSSFPNAQENEGGIQSSSLEESQRLLGYLASFS